MAAITLNILKPSVNNLTVRIFVRAAELDFEEQDVWGKTTSPEYLEKYPAHLTPMIEEEGLPKGTLGESCAIMAYLCNKHGLEEFYPTDPGKRAMVDNAMFYLIGTFYPLLTRATYPALGFPQYPGEVGTSAADDAMKATAQQDAEAALGQFFCGPAATDAAADDDGVVARILGGLHWVPTGVQPSNRPGMIGVVASNLATGSAVT